MEIKSVSQYIDEIRKLRNKTFGTQLASSPIFYRGQSDKAYTFEPSIFRNCQLNEEGKMLRELILKAPREFENSSTFVKLTKVQHYGLPTRLLDISTNPLVALFFACQENTSRNGEVYAIAQLPTIHEEKDVEIFSSLALMEKTEFNVHDFGNFLVKKGLMTEAEVLQNGMLKYFGKRYIIVIPPMSNERVIRQQGAFILFGGKLDTDKNKIIKENYNLDNEFKVDSESNKYFEIPASKKTEILYTLDDLGINESTLFPELEHQAKYIKEKMMRL